MTQAHTGARIVTATRGSAGLATAEQARTVERSVGAVGLAAIGLIHLLDAPGKLSETPYMFWLYIALIAGCLAGATLLLRGHSQRAWLAAVALSTMPFVGYVLSRSTGLPGATGDIGNWTEPLGLASLFIEACICALSLTMLAQFGMPALRLAGKVGQRSAA